MGVKISDLPASTAAARAMLFEVSNAGVSERLTLSQMFALSTGAVTTDSPALNMAQSWTAAGVTLTGWRLNVTDTASAADSKLLDLQVGAASKFAVRKDGEVSASTFTFTADASSGFYSGGQGTLSFKTEGSPRFNLSGPDFDLLSYAGHIGWNTDTFLCRDAANTLALRNGANAQTFNLYNTHTDASNYERARLLWNGNKFYIGTVNAGTGTQRPLSLDGSQLELSVGQSERWRITESGHLVAPSADNTYDIGANGANRPRNIYAAGRISGQLQTHAAAVSKSITPNSTLTLYDSNGTAYKVPCVAA